MIYSRGQHLLSPLNYPERCDAMNIFDIMGPVMVGPSSSHTAGAVRIGRVARRMLGSLPARAGRLPSIRRATRPMRTAPAVWELLGPTMTGPMISKMFIASHLSG